MATWISGLPLSLNITPINAANRAFPEGLESYYFSSDTVINRFKTFLDTVHATIPAVFGPMLDAVTSRYTTKALFLEETGFAASSVCRGTEYRQAEYVSEIFKAWDEHADRLAFVGVLWLHDLSQMEAEVFVGAYGMTSVSGVDPFVEYLRSLGL